MNLACHPPWARRGARVVDEPRLLTSGVGAVAPDNPCVSGNTLIHRVAAGRGEDQPRTQQWVSHGSATVNFYFLVAMSSVRTSLLQAPSHIVSLHAGAPCMYVNVYAWLCCPICTGTNRKSLAASWNLELGFMILCLSPNIFISSFISIRDQVR